MIRVGMRLRWHFLMIRKQLRIKVEERAAPPT